MVDFGFLSVFGDLLDLDLYQLYITLCVAIYLFYISCFRWAVDGGELPVNEVNYSNIDRIIFQCFKLDRGH